jgi:hypothetical protein
MVHIRLGSELERTKSVLKDDTMSDTGSRQANTKGQPTVHRTQGVQQVCGVFIVRHYMLHQKLAEAWRGKS